MQEERVDVISKTLQKCHYAKDARLWEAWRFSILKKKTIHRLSGLPQTPEGTDLVLLAVSQTCKARGVRPLPFCLHACLPQGQKSCQTLRTAECIRELLLPLRFHWFLTNRRPSLLTSRVKVAISLTIIFTYKLGNQGILLPRQQDWHNHRGTTPLALNQFAGELATKQRFFRSQQWQEIMLKQVVEPVSRDTKEKDDYQ